MVPKTSIKLNLWNLPTREGKVTTRQGTKHEPKPKMTPGSGKESEKVKGVMDTPT